MDTRPSIVDPVSVLDAAHGSHRVTQKNRSSSAELHSWWCTVSLAGEVVNASNDVGRRDTGRLHMSTLAPSLLADTQMPIVKQVGPFEDSHA